MKFYRLLEDGEEIWRGKALDIEHAEERAFWSEQPGSLCRYTLQYWGQVKISSEMKTAGWVTVYENQHFDLDFWA